MNFRSSGSKPFIVGAGEFNQNDSLLLTPILTYIHIVYVRAPYLAYVIYVKYDIYDIHDIYHLTCIYRSILMSKETLGLLECSQPS